MVDIIRKVQLFVLHAHRIPQDDYSKLFASIAALSQGERIFRQGSSYIGFPIFERYQEGYFIQAVEGVEGEAPIIFDVEQGDARIEQLPMNEMYAHATHLFVLPSERRALIEYVRRGAKAARISKAIEGVARQHLNVYVNTRLEMTPRVISNFISQLDAFERIREASIRVSRPNASWTDHYTDLSDLIETSNGDTATVDIKAGRGESLSSDSGIVNVVKEIVSDKEPYLEEAIIKGTREGESSETTLRSSKFVAQSQIRVQADVARSVAPTDMRSKLREVSFRLLQTFR